ncbi:hypothetical protein SETIT_8G117900v2 [Setaria italica]|uniref:BTB domain-containing protein n=1 Tax=Setaria italica TaxID=4555 RepID=K3ZMK5_SETIT|nr:BTB/POZ and MATH domain-containing protein 2 [Setaria italica]RCV38133.1 hypothetical protein SETIT_8G117900v2 [Setaria italica]
MPPSTKPPAAPFLPAGAVLPAPRSESEATGGKTLLMDTESYSDAKKLPNSRCIRSPKLDAGGRSAGVKRLEPSSKAAAAPVSGLHADIAGLLVAKEGKDVDFEVGGKMFAAHRCVLAARSSVFKADLFGPAIEEDTTYIRIDDIIPEAFDALLHFIYTDSLPEMNLHAVELMAQHLLVAAQRYDLKDLKSIMENRLCSQVDVTTALCSLVLAEQHKCSMLKKKCLDFIASGENARKVMESNGAEDLVKTCPSVVRDLIIKVLNASRSQLGFTKIIFYVAVSIGILNLNSVCFLKLISVVLMVLLVFVRYHA